MTKNVNIAVVDDHKLFLKGFTLLVDSLSDRFVTTGFDAPVDFLVELESGTKFDLIVCDLIMNSMNGLAFIAALRNHSKRLPILVLSGINTAPPIAEIKRLGGNGFIHKSVENNILSEAIEALLIGKSFFFDGLDESVIENPESFESERETSVGMTSNLPALGTRQIEVLRLMAEGATNKDISSILKISENTVKTHLKHIFQELGVNKRTACTRKAQLMGLI
jgi:DNA-binding NarL/FixJ family response regulator